VRSVRNWLNRCDHVVDASSVDVCIASTNPNRFAASVLLR
jgi:hypothetical protein